MLNWPFSNLKTYPLTYRRRTASCRHSDEKPVPYLIRGWFPLSPSPWTPAFAGVPWYLMPYVYLPVLSVRTGLVLVAHVGIGYVDCVPDR